MGKKPNPATIGAFVVGAFALAVAGVLVFGSGQYFRHLEKYVLFFPGSVNGLVLGAPVKFRGVDIGTVKDIRLVLEPGRTERQVTIPVYVETDPSKITLDGKPMDMHDPVQLRAMIERGLRAQLQSQSLVTGLLFVQIDFFPDTPATYVLQQPSKPTEIPTVPTTLEQASSAAREIIAELRSIKFGPMVQEASEALQGLNELVHSPALHTAIDGLPATVINVNEAVASLRRMSEDLSRQVAPISNRLGGTLANADQTMTTVRETVGAARILIEPGSPLDHDLRKTLLDVSTAARALAQLADYLERNPSALLYGKQAPAGEKP
jgi:paraquat-inducible protein B